MSGGTDHSRKPRAASGLLKRIASVGRRLAARPFTLVFRSVDRMHSPLVRSARFESLQSEGALALVRDGEETFVVFTSDQIISRTLYIRGNRFFDRMNRTLELLGETFRLKTLVDVGANIGIVAVPAVHRGIASRAIAIEPAPENYRLLVANIHLNGVADRVEHHNLALGPRSNETVDFELSSDNSGDHRVSVSREDGLFGESRRTRIRVRSTRFDDVVSGLDPLDSLIWMEAQGYEGPILEGAGRAVSARIPVLAEFCPYLMRRAGSYERFVQVVSAYRAYVDLADEERRRLPVSSESIHGLADRLGNQGGYTDILLT